MDYQEAIERHVEECKHRIDVINNFMKTNGDADKDKCLENIEIFKTAISAMQELEEYKKMEEDGRLIKLPCAVGDTVYEILHDDIPESVDYICEYTVDDISANAINFCGDWNPLDSIPNVFFSREEAEEALRRLKEVPDDR